MFEKCSWCFIAYLASICFFDSFACFVIQMRGLEEELERRTLTYTLWNQSTSKLDMKGWHPVTFKTADDDARLIKNIKVLCKNFNYTSGTNQLPL